MKLPKLSLRELFLLVIIAAIGCGWWVDRSRIANRERVVEDRMRQVRELEAKQNAELVYLHQMMLQAQQAENAENLRAKIDPVPVTNP